MSENTMQIADNQELISSDGPAPITLDNGVVVRVTRMAEHEMLRAASIFDPEQAESLSARGEEDIDPKDLIKLWRGNERYVLYVVECSCELVSPLPKDDSWINRPRRYADLYGIVPEDLAYLDYLEAVYIRFMGMTNDAFVAAVSNVAMGIDPTKTQEAAPAGNRRQRRLAQK